MSFEEVSNLFEGYSYTEVNITTGFNLDHLQNIIVERLHQDAKSKFQVLTEPVKRKYISENFLIGLLFFAASLLFYSMFMFIGLMLSDYAFATDKWYSQVLVYILSIIICVIDAIITMIVPSFCINVVEGEEEQAGLLS